MEILHKDSPDRMATMVIEWLQAGQLAMSIPMATVLPDNHQCRFNDRVAATTFREIIPIQ